MDHDVALAEPTSQGAVPVRAGAIFDWKSPHQSSSICSDPEKANNVHELSSIQARSATLT
jgi:hypothetical protein